MANQFTPQTKYELKKEYTDNVKSLTPVNDVIEGSVIDTIADTHADTMFEQQVQIKGILDLDNLDNKEGEELDTEGRAYSLYRSLAQKAVGKVEIIDSAIVKKYASVASGGASVGATTLNVINVVNTFPTSGWLLIGERTEPEFETIAYTDFDGSVFTLASQIQKDHGLNEPVVLKTVGDRNLSSGTTVYAENDDGDKIKYGITEPYIIYDGEDRAYGVPIIAEVAGEVGNAPADTIVYFDGTEPFEGAEVNNPEVIDNGIDRQSDASFRDDIRNRPFTLSRGVRQAVIDEVLKAEYNGQRVKFVQPYESIDSTEPSECYIDDGSGFVPTEEVIAKETIIESAILGDFLFYLSDHPRLKKDGLTGGKTINLYKNGNVLLTEGVDYKINFHDGTIKLLEGKELQSGESLHAGDDTNNGYIKYTGLMQEAQWRIDGKRDDKENYEGAKAFGNQITVKVPNTQDIDVELEIFTNQGTAKSYVKPQIIQNILEYISSINIGGTIILDQLRLSALKVDGVTKVVFASPTDDINLPIGTKARIDSANITIL